MTDVVRSTELETAVRASVVVRAPIEHAFEVFTSDIGSWWPDSHHIGSVPMVAAYIEPRVGGRWYELGDDGSECLWGVVLAWDPPKHVALSWHLDGDFRYDPEITRSSRVDVRFRALDADTTLVELEHSGLDHHGPGWQRLQGPITRGWAFILGRFGDRTGSVT